eukprot:264981_1
MCVEIACMLLLSTILWDLSIGGKGGLQLYREPLSILELATVVVYLYISLSFYFSIHKGLNSSKWYKLIGSIIKIEFINLSEMVYGELETMYLQYSDHHKIKFKHIHYQN